MFRNVFIVIAALLVSANDAPAATNSADVPLDQRIAKAKVKIAELGSMAAPDSTLGPGEPAPKVRLSQHWHNHHWNNWHNWNNGTIIGETTTATTITASEGRLRLTLLRRTGVEAWLNEFERNRPSGDTANSILQH